MEGTLSFWPFLNMVYEKSFGNSVVEFLLPQGKTTSVVKAQGKMYRVTKWLNLVSLSSN